MGRLISEVSAPVSCCQVLVDDDDAAGNDVCSDADAEDNTKNCQKTASGQAGNANVKAKAAKRAASLAAAKALLTRLLDIIEQHGGIKEKLLDFESRKARTRTRTCFFQVSELPDGCASEF